MRRWQGCGYAVLAVVLIGCGKGGKPDDKVGSKGADESGKKQTVDPKSKEAAVIVLREFHKAAEGKEYDKAMAFFVPGRELKAPPFPGKTEPIRPIPPESNEDKCKRMLERKEISAKGINILVEKGKWAKFMDEAKTDREKERVRSIAREIGVEPESLYYLGMEEREGSAHFTWDGKQFKIVKIDDIGRLEEPPPTKTTVSKKDRRPHFGPIRKVDAASRMVSVDDKYDGVRDFTIPDDIPVTAGEGKIKVPAKSLFKYLQDGMFLRVTHDGGKVTKVEIREEIKLDE